MNRLCFGVGRGCVQWKKNSSFRIDLTIKHVKITISWCLTVNVIHKTTITDHNLCYSLTFSCYHYIDSNKFEYVNFSSIHSKIYSNVTTGSITWQARILPKTCSLLFSKWGADTTMSYQNTEILILSRKFTFYDGHLPCMLPINTFHN